MAKNRKKLIWIIGSMASGKSTQRKLLCERLGDGEEADIKIVKGEINTTITSWGKTIGIPGKAGGSQCDGLDSSFGLLKKVGAVASTELSIKKHDITVLEGSQTTFFWTDDLINMCKRNKCDFYLIHLKLDDVEVVNRLVKRNEAKGTEVNDNKIKNVLGKNLQYYNIYDKIKDREGIIPRRINAKKSIEKIFDEIIDFCFQ